MLLFMKINRSTCSQSEVCAFITINNPSEIGPRAAGEKHHNQTNKNKNSRITASLHARHIPLSYLPLPHFTSLWYTPEMMLFNAHGT